MFRFVLASVAPVVPAWGPAWGPSMFPNSGYLGQGYDIFKGNPHAQDGESDPGIRLEGILQLPYTEGLLTQDHRHAIPDRTTAVSTKGDCSVDMEAQKQYGAQAYSNSLSVDISTDFKGFGAKFSASTAYKDVSKKTSSQKSMFSDTKATCSVYRMKAHESQPPIVSDDFSYAVEVLPSSFDSNSAQAFFTFIRRYGTHLVTEVEMGGRFGRHFEFSQEGWVKVHESSVNVDTAAKHAGIISAGAECDTDQETQEARAFLAASTGQHSYTVGGKYSRSTDEWIAALSDEPAPIKFTLKRLDEILTSLYMPGLDEDTLRSRQVGLRAAIDNYCEELRSGGELESCDAPPDDQPMEMRHQTWWSNGNFRGSSNSRECRQNQYVTGISFVEQSGYGLVDMAVTCSDGESWRYWNIHAGSWNHGLVCDQGFSKVQGNEQDGYGIVNFKTYCSDGYNPLVSNNNQNGRWNTEIPCPSWAPVVVGFQTHYQSGYGIINFSPVCSNGNGITGATVDQFVV